MNNKEYVELVDKEFVKNFGKFIQKKYKGFEGKIKVDFYIYRWEIKFLVNGKECKNTINLYNHSAAIYNYENIDLPIEDLWRKYMYQKFGEEYFKYVKSIYESNIKYRYERELSKLNDDLKIMTGEKPIHSAKSLEK